MFRVFTNKTELLFLENANSSKHEPLGYIVQAGPNNWEYFPDRHRGLNLTQTLMISAKLSELNNREVPIESIH